MQFSSLLVASCAVVFPVTLVSAQNPRLPSTDPFYVQPANISLYKLGEPIRNRTLSPQLQGLTQFSTLQVGAVFQYMYRSNDSIGQPVADVMTYLVPQNNTDRTKLLAYSIAYDSANNDCSPSYSLQPGANNSIASEIVLIQAALDNGWHVVTSDYEGLKAQFVAGIQSGKAVLDSLRASLNPIVRQNTNLSASAKYALWGYSGGSLASEWAAELAPSYAPDLNIAGVAIGGLEPNVTNVLLTINSKLPAGLAFSGTLGLAAAYSNLSQYITSQYGDAAKQAYFNYIGSGCQSQTSQRGLNQDLFSYFKAGPSLIYSPVVSTVFSGAGQMGTHGTPRSPLYVYKSAGDEVSPIADTDELVQEFCDRGVTLEYLRNSFGEHITESYLGSPGAFAWLKDRLSGKPVAQPQRCWIQDVFIANLTSAGAQQALGSELASAYQSFFGNEKSPYWGNKN